MRGFVTAVRTLTIFPCPGRDADNFANSLPYFPIVGLILGAISASACFLFDEYHLAWPIGGAIIATVLSVVLTRGLHLDGLADATDALGGGRTVERRLVIMKDPHMGAFGVMAIICVLLLKFAAYGQDWDLRDGLAWRWLLLPFIISRTLQVCVITLLPYARKEGGTAGVFVQGARRFHLVLAFLVSLVLCFAIARVVGVVLLCAAFLAGLLLRRWMLNKFNGVTGDLVGMTNELFESGLLVFVAATSRYLLLWPLCR